MKQHTNKSKNKTKTSSTQSTKAPKKRKNSKTQSTIEPKLRSKEFYKLQAEWYAKLKSEGFNDLERFTNVTESHDANRLLNGQSMRSIALKKNWESTYHHYSRMRNFVTHCPRWAGPDAVRSLVGRLYSEGVSFREIVNETKRLGLKSNMNKWHVHHMVKDFVLKATLWNQRDPRGLDFVPDIGGE